MLPSEIQILSELGQWADLFVGMTWGKNVPTRGMVSCPLTSQVLFADHASLSLSLPICSFLFLHPRVVWAADGGSGCPLHSQPEGSPRLPHVRGGVSSFCGREEWATKTKRILEPSSGDRLSRGTPLSSAVHLCHLGSLGPLGTSIGSSFSSCLNVQ